MATKVSTPFDKFLKAGFTVHGLTNASGFIAFRNAKRQVKYLLKPFDGVEEYLVDTIAESDFTDNRDKPNRKVCKSIKAAITAINMP